MGIIILISSNAKNTPKLALLICLILLIPIAVVSFSWLLPVNLKIWSHLLEIVLLDISLNSIYLVLGVSSLSAVMGVSLAWITTMKNFPTRKLISAALIIPLSFPTYVMAFIYSFLLEYSGPVYSLLRIFDKELSLSLELPKIVKVIIAISFSLFPYVYLLSRQAFLSQGKMALEVGSTLGKSNREIFWKISLKMAFPWIMAGTALIAMETLSDFGAVSVFVFDTYTTAIYKSWFGFFSPVSASQLSTILLVFVAFPLYFQSLGRKKQKYFSMGETSNRFERNKLKGISKIGTLIYCYFIVAVTSIIPIWVLLRWALLDFNLTKLLNILPNIYNSLIFGVCAAFSICIIGLYLTCINRFQKTFVLRLITNLSLFGYAVPGSVLALGVYLPVNHLEQFLDTWLIESWNISDFSFSAHLSSSGIIVIFGLTVRFLAVGYSAINNAQKRIPDNLDEVSLTLGASKPKIIKEIHLPLLKGGIYTGFLLAFVESLKELPLTLMTRPFGWDTLSIKVFQYTSEGQWSQAALPSLVILMTGIIPVLFLMKKLEN